MITKNTFEKAKNLYKKGMSLRQISIQLNINRKTLSKKFKEENVKIKWGIDEETFKKCLKMLEQGSSRLKICKHFNIDTSTLNNKLKEHNLYISKTKNVYRNTNYDQEILELYKQNKSISKISKQLNVSNNLIFNCLKDYNYKKHNYNKYDYDKSIFEKIDNEEKAYWLGFLYADGYVDEFRGIELTLAKKDKEHLEKFKSFLKTNMPLTYRKKQEAWRLSINCKQIALDLIKQGCFQNKSLVLKFPSSKQVPKKYIHHFMRGYFDGDGCIFCSQNQKKISIVGTKDFLDEYDNILYKKCKLTTKNKYCRTGKAYNLRRGGNLQVNKIFKFLYKDATIYLERKYARFAVLR